MMPDLRQRLRDKLFPWLTLGVAAFWAIAGFKASSEITDEILESNSARLYAGMMVGAMGLPADDDPESAALEDEPTGLLPSFELLTGPRTGPSPPPATRTSSATASRPANPMAASLARLQRATGVVEGVVHAWKWMMHGEAAALALLALFAMATGRARAMHLVAAVLMLVGTAATLVGMGILSHPDGGALPHLPVRAYLLTGALLSAYAWLCLLAFARPPRADRSA